MKNYLKKKLNKKGFTLIELIVVIAILAILALVLVPSISNYVTEANKSKDLANVRSVYTQLTADVAMGVVTNPTVAADPKTGPNYKWGFTVTKGVPSGVKTDLGYTKTSSYGIPDNMKISYTIANGVVSSFSATITGGETYEATTSGEVKVKASTPVGG